MTFEGEKCRSNDIIAEWNELGVNHIIEIPL